MKVRICLTCEKDNVHVSVIVSVTEAKGESYVT